MHRFYLSPEEAAAPEPILIGGEARHATVLRLQPGQRVVVLDGAGQEVLCEARWFQANSVGLSVVRRERFPRLAFEVTLLQAVPKGKIFEDILQKATELSVYRVVPVISERVVPRLEESDFKKRLEKWHAVAVEAIKQCGSPWLPIIERPVRVQDFLNRGERLDLSLIASLQPRTAHPRKYFDRFREEQRREPQSVAVWIGPEGDFTPAEMNSIQAGGALPITLGKVVLRAETAAVYALSVINYELGNQG